MGQINPAYLRHYMNVLQLAAMFAIHAAHPIVHHPHASRPDSDAREHVAYLCLHLERSAPMVFHARKLSLHHNPCKSPSRHAVDIRAAQIQLSGSQCPEFRIMVAPVLPSSFCYSRPIRTIHFSVSLGRVMIGADYCSTSPF